MIGLMLAVAAVGWSPVSASATTYYASPTGPAADPCTQPTPCSLEYAVETKAVSGDEVIVLPGNYSVELSSLVVADTITLRGLSPAQRPTIVIDPGPADTDGVLVNAPATLRDLRIASLGTAQALDLNEAGVTAERLYVTGEGLAACGLSWQGGVLRDSVCVNESSGGDAVLAGLGGAVTFTFRMVNVTAVATGTNTTADGLALTTNNGANLTVNATNVIAIGGGGADVRVVTNTSGETGTVNLDHSNYDTIGAEGPGTEGITIPGPVAGSNQTAPPAFAPGTGNYHQAAGSPTIDMGAVNPLNGGTLDIDGEARVQGSSQDIGADEFTVVVQPPVTPGPQLPLGTAALLSRSAKAKGPTVPLLFACPAGDRNCDGNEVVLKTAAPIALKGATSSAKRKVITLGAASFSVPAGRTQLVQVPLTKRARKLLRLRGKVATRATVTGGGTSSTAALTIRTQRKRR